jgi:hypothetical protein
MEVVIWYLSAQLHIKCITCDPLMCLVTTLFRQKITQNGVFRQPQTTDGPASET